MASTHYKRKKQAHLSDRQIRIRLVSDKVFIRQEQSNPGRATNETINQLHFLFVSFFCLPPPYMELRQLLLAVHSRGVEELSMAPRRVSTFLLFELRPATSSRITSAAQRVLMMGLLSCLT